MPFRLRQADEQSACFVLEFASFTNQSQQRRSRLIDRAHQYVQYRQVKTGSGMCGIEVESLQQGLTRGAVILTNQRYHAELCPRSRRVRSEGGRTVQHSYGLNGLVLSGQRGRERDEQVHIVGRAATAEAQAISASSGRSSASNVRPIASQAKWFSGSSRTARDSDDRPSSTEPMAIWDMPM